MIPIIEILNKGLKGTGDNKHLAALARLAIIFIAYNSQQQAVQQKEILADLASVKAQLEHNDERITWLENTVAAAYDTASKAIPTPPTKGTHHERNSNLPQ